MQNWHGLMEDFSIVFCALPVNFSWGVHRSVLVSMLACLFLVHRPISWPRSCHRRHLGHQVPSLEWGFFVEGQGVWVWPFLWIFLQRPFWLQFYILDTNRGYWVTFGSSVVPGKWIHTRFDLQNYLIYRIFILTWQDF